MCGSIPRDATASVVVHGVLRRRSDSDCGVHEFEDRRARREEAEKAADLGLEVFSTLAVRNYTSSICEATGKRSGTRPPSSRESFF